MSKRKLFKFYYSYYEVAKELNDKDRLEFLWAIMQRQFEGIEPNLKGIAKIAYVGQKHSIDAQIKGWEDKMREELTPMQGGSVGGMQGGMQGGSVAPPLQEEVKEKVKEKEKEEEEYTFRDELFNRWLAYKKEKNQSYKPSGLAALKKQWENKTDAELEAAINNSMVNNYNGLFEPKQPNLFSQTKSNHVYHDPPEQDRDARRIKNQLFLHTDKVRKDYILGFNYTEEQLQDYLEANIKGYKRP